MTNISILPKEFVPLRLATAAQISQRYAELTADYNPIHLDPDFAAGTPFRAPIAHGTLSLGLLLLCAEQNLGARWTINETQIRFSRPVMVGEAVIAGGRQSDADPTLYDVFAETEAGNRALEGILRVRPASP